MNNGIILTTSFFMHPSLSSGPSSHSDFGFPAGDVPYDVPRFGISDRIWDIDVRLWDKLDEQYDGHIHGNRYSM